jgi:methyl-accepting chemotaxis protein
MMRKGAGRATLSAIVAVVDLGCLLLAASIFLLSGRSGIQGLPTAARLIFGLAAALGAGLSVCLALYVAARLPAQSRVVQAAQERLLAEEVKRLGDSLAEFSTGNIGARIELPRGSDSPEFQLGALAPVASGHARIRSALLECVDDFNTITFEPCDRVCYVGTDNYLEGERCGELLGGMLSGRGEVAILLNSFEKVNHRLRYKGFTNRLAKSFPEMRVVEAVETGQVPESTYRRTIELLGKWPRLAGIYVDEASTPHKALEALRDGGRLGSVAAVAHDVTELSVEWIRSGHLTTLSQNPFNQGYDSIVNAYNFLVSGERPLIDRLLPKSSELEVIDARSLGQFWDDRAGRVLSEKARRSLTAPRENRSRTPLRISALLPDDAGFFRLVGKGMREAAAALLPHGATVSIIVPDEMKRGDNSAAATRAYLEREAAGGAKALVTPIYDKALVQFVNRLAGEGVAVATYNSEPIGLRAMIGSVFANSDYILDSSETLAANAIESMEATRQIKETMERIAGSAADQRLRLEGAEKSIQSLLSDVELATGKSGESIGTADDAISYAAVGQSKVSQTNESLGAIQASYRKTTELLSSLSDNSERIRDIVAMMEDFASQTNLIAINVSILAARLGKDSSGFTVVAGEIRKLAEQSAIGAVNIGALIKSTLKDVKDVIGIIRKDESDIDAIVEYSRQAKASLDDIIEITARNRDGVHSIIDLISDMKALSMQVSSAMRLLDELNYSNTQAIEGISMNSGEMARQVGDNAKVSQVLCDMARSQKELLSQYFN